MIHKTKSEAAVSPVIGTILLVAIAVILVAIILIVVMGFSGETNERKVGLNAKPASGPDAMLMLYGGESIPDLTKLEMIDQGSSRGEYIEFWNIACSSANVGYPYQVIDVARPNERLEIYDTIINVRGTFSDGKEVILLVQPMTFNDVAPPMGLSEYVSSVVFKTGNPIQSSQDVMNEYQKKYISVPVAGTYFSTASGGHILIAGTEVTLSKPLPTGYSIKATVASIAENSQAKWSSASSKTGTLTKQSTTQVYSSWAFSVRTGVADRSVYGPFLFTVTIYSDTGTPVASETWYLMGYE